MRPARAFVPLLLGGALLASAPLSAADAPAAGILTVHVAGLRSANGQVGCMLFASEKGFPKDPNAAIQKRWTPIAGAEATATFDPIPAGTYALACFHDENGNGKMDTGLFGIPKEGTVTSNQAKGFMGPPSFKDAKFAFPATGAELRLRMGY